MSTGSKNNDYILELQNVSKVFPGVRALDNVSFGVRKGEVHALVGENGAGKSTLINIISGVYAPTEGRLIFEGQPVKVAHPQDAFHLGIGVVHQERNLIDTFNIMENLCFNYIAESMKGTIKKDKMKQIAKKALDRVKLDLPLNGSITKLSSGQKQMLEIARGLAQDSKVLLLDEPTASISLGEVETLLQTVEMLKEEGVSIIYISHKLEEIFRVADTITVIRDGKKIGESFATSEVTRDQLIEKMVGRKTEKVSLAARDFSEAPVALEAREVYSKLDANKKSFQLKKGEILGWYGLVGAGRTELARQLIGIDPIIGGEILVNGKKVAIKNFKQAIKNCKLYYISENRKEEGLFLNHTIATNIAVASLDKLVNKARLIQYKQIKELATRYSSRLQVKSKGISDKVINLSGGNQQKVCIAKGLATEPEIIIIDEPTVGIDVNTKAEIHKLIHELSETGVSIIVISSDLTEIVSVADRVMVFKDNQIKGELANLKDYDVMSKNVMNYILD